MPEHTDQLELIDFWIHLQIVHDVPVLVPGKHEAEVGDRSRYPIERENILVFELFHHRHFLTKPLPHLSEQPPEIVRHLHF